MLSSLLLNFLMKVILSCQTINDSIVITIFYNKIVSYSHE